MRVTTYDLEADAYGLDDLFTAAGMDTQDFSGYSVLAARARATRKVKTNDEAPTCR